MPFVNTRAKGADFALLGTSGANAALTLTQPAPGPNNTLRLARLSVSWTGGAVAAGANVQIKDGATVVYDLYYGRGADAQGLVDLEFTVPLVASPNSALQIAAAAGGAGVALKVAALGYTLNSGDL